MPKVPQLGRAGELDPEPCSLSCCKVLSGKGAAGIQIRGRRLLMQALPHCSEIPSETLGLSFPFMPL